MGPFLSTLCVVSAAKSASSDSIESDKMCPRTAEVGRLAYRSKDCGRRQSMCRQNIVMAAIAMHEFVLQREGVQRAFGLNIPGDLFGLRRQAALGHVLLEDDQLLVPAQHVSEALAVEWLHGRTGNQRHRLPLVAQR